MGWHGAAAGCVTQNQCNVEQVCNVRTFSTRWAKANVHGRNLWKGKQAKENYFYVVLLQFIWKGKDMDSVWQYGEAGLTKFKCQFRFLVLWPWSNYTISLSSVSLSIKWYNKTYFWGSECIYIKHLEQWLALLFKRGNFKKRLRMNFVWNNVSAKICSHIIMFAPTRTLRKGHSKAFNSSFGKM